MAFGIDTRDTLVVFFFRGFSSCGLEDERERCFRRLAAPAVVLVRADRLPDFNTTHDKQRNYLIFTNYYHFAYCQRRLFRRQIHPPLRATNTLIIKVSKQQWCQFQEQIVTVLIPTLRFIIKLINRNKRMRVLLIFN